MESGIDVATLPIRNSGPSLRLGGGIVRRREGAPRRRDVAVEARVLVVVDFLEVDADFFDADRASARRGVPLFPRERRESARHAASGCAARDGLRAAGL